MGWEIAAVAGGVVIVLGLAVLILRNVRKRGKAEGKLEDALEREGDHEEADAIMAEPIGDTVGWSDRMRKFLPKKK